MSNNGDGKESLVGSPAAVPSGAGRRGSERRATTEDAPTMRYVVLFLVNFRYSEAFFCF